MSEHKKVEFSTVGSTKEVKKSIIKCRTIRLLVTLPESNEKSCPEFNYGDLLSLHLRDRLGKKTMGEVINGPSLDAKDPFATDEDEALRLLARKFEKKYGLGEAGKPRKRKRENTDFKKLGEGYDETDPFIDNSDAVDDVVPTNMETKHRGFYINSGALDFEEVQVSEEEDDAASVDSVVKNKKTKRIESSDDEDAGSAIEEKEETPVNKNKIRENGIIATKKRDLDEGEQLRKRKRMIDKFNAKKLKTGKVESETEAKSPIPEVKEAEAPKPPMEKSIAASIEAVVNKARQLAVNDLPEEPEEAENKKEEKEDSSSSAGSSSSSSSSSSESSSSDSESDDEKESENEEEKKVEVEEEVATSMDLENGILSPSENEKEVCLPRDLPKDLMEIIDQLKEYGKNNKETSSQKFFTEAVKKLLLSIEIKLCKFGGRKKTLIYNHLSLHLPCGTQTLVKRGKTSLLEFLENRMEGPRNRLKEAVNAVMPALIESHAGECQKIVEQNPQQYWELYYHFWGEGQAQPEKESGDTTQKKVKLPKKKFTFTKEIREALCEVVKVRCKAWQMVKKRSETPEVHITKFLDSEVKTIWPKGWITAKILYKESEAAHAHITAKESNKVAAGVIPQKKVTVLGGGVVNNNNNNDIQTITKNSEENGPKEVIPKDKLQQEKPAKNELKDAKEVVPSKHSSLIIETKASLEVSKSEVKEKSNISEVEVKVKKDENLTKTQSPSLPITTKSLPNDVSTKDVTIKKPRNLQGGVQVPSPISDSSSFLGFESPTRVHSHPNMPVSGSGKLSSVINTTKKVFDSEAVPHVREGKPPKPSLTATALPKITTAANIMMPIGNVEVIKKIIDEKSHSAQHFKSNDEQAVKCISIKSVDKINETFKVNLPAKKDFNKEHVGLNIVGAGAKDKRTLSTESSKSGDSVSVIDVSSDDEKRKTSDKPKCNLKKDEPNISVSSLDLSLRSDKSADNDSPVKNINTSGSGDTMVKDNKLEQEMDQVMLELLQISKQKKSNEEKTKDQHHIVPVTNLREAVSKPAVSKLETSPDQSQKMHQVSMPPRSVEPMLSPTQLKTPPTMKSPVSGFSSSPIISKKAHLLADPNANYTPTVDTSLQRKSPTTSISQVSPRSSNPVDLISSHSDSSKGSGIIQIHSSIISKPSSGPSIISDNNPNSIIKNASDASSRYCKDDLKVKGLPSSLSITTSSSSNSGVNYTTAKTVNVIQLQRNLMSPPSNSRNISSSQQMGSQREFSGSHKVDIMTAASNSDSGGQSMSIDLTVPFKKDNGIPQGRDLSSYQMIENSIKSMKRFEHQTPSQRYRHDQLSPHKENTTSRSYPKPPQRDQPSSQGGNYYTQGGHVAHQTSRLSSPGNQSSGSRSSSSPQQSSGRSASPPRGQKSPQLGPPNVNQRGSAYLQGSHRPSQSSKMIGPSSNSVAYSTSLSLVSSNSDRLSQSSVKSPQIGHHAMSQSKSPVSSHSLTSPSYNSSSKNHPSDRGSPRSSSSSSTSHTSPKVPSHNIDGLLYNSPYTSNPRPPSSTNQPNQNRYPPIPSQLSTSHKHEKLHSSSSTVPTWTNDPTRRSKPSSTKHKSSDNYPTASQSVPHSSSSLSAQPKLKHRNEHYPSSHSMMANLTTEQQVELIKQQSNNQQDFWQQMNAGGFLPGMPPNESYKYRSQTGSYLGANNSSGGSSKKNQQY